MSYSPLHGKLKLPTTNNNILSKPRGPYPPLSKRRSWKRKWSGGCVCNVKFGNPLASDGQSSPKLNSTLSASFPTPKKRILTRTYFARDQVPDCLNFTRAKNKLPSWDKYFRHRHSMLFIDERVYPLRESQSSSGDCELKSHYNIHFQTNALGKSLNLLILAAIG